MRPCCCGWDRIQSVRGLWELLVSRLYVKGALRRVLRCNFILPNDGSPGQDSFPSPPDSLVLLADLFACAEF